MFQNAHSFNGNISNWCTNKVQNMSNMFNNALLFNSDISNWNTNKVK